MNTETGRVRPGRGSGTEARGKGEPQIWRLRRLRRAEDSEQVAQIVTNRLVALVQAQPEGAGVSLTWHGRADGRVLVEVEAVGVDASFGSDLDWVGRDAHEWEAIAGPRTPCPSHLCEVLGAPSAREDHDDGGGPALVDGPADRMPTGERRTTWPGLQASDSQLLLGILNEVGGYVRVRIGNAGGLEAMMAEEAFASTERLRSGGEVNAYLGAPMRLRVLLGSDDPQGIPARLWIAMRDWVSGARRRDLTGRRLAERLWNGADALVGAAQPEGLVKAFARLPVAGGHARIIGIPVAGPVAGSVPLSDRALANGSDGMRLGTATTATGAVSDVHLSVPGALQHMQIVGGSGTGKSTLAAALVHSLARAGRGGVVLDPHGHLVRRIADELPQAALDRCLFIDCGDAARAVPVNLFHCGDFETVCSEFIEMLYLVLDPKRTGIVGPRFERIFRQLASVLHHLFGSDLPITLIPALLTDDGLLKRVSDSLSDIDPGLARGIRTELIANRSSEYGEVIAWTASKFERLVRSPVMRAALGTGADALDLNGVMAANGIVLIDLSAPRIGRDQAQMLGMMWLTKIALAMPGRWADDKPFHVVVDEAHLFQESLLSEMLAEGRKFGLALAVAHQHMGQLTPSLRDALQGNASSVIAFRTSVRDAPEVEERLGTWTGGSLSRLANLSAAATLATRDGQTQAFTLRVDHNEQVRDGAVNGEPVVHAFGRVSAQSCARLVAPFSGSRPKRAEDVERAARELRESRQGGRPSEESGGGRSDSGARSYLDMWLERRARAAEPAASDQP